ncbi:hypothetical protein PLICRDRAFT_160086 [Plicaturopsis crispa FD-325 SS-3]|nr:hypothetical protein PLICRDRAFT_160086 [Plicaturopsis crispa FD-325 SS-3]
MVQLTLCSPKGNQGVRYFPYSGYLGLTPLKVEGIVRTRLDPDGKLLPAKSLTVSVRCYESRLGRVGVLHSNILVEHSQTLWSKAADRDFIDVGDLEFPFRITIPADVAGVSTANFQDYKAIWRVEAVLNHASIAGVGSRQTKYFELPLIRYDLPPLPPPPSPEPSSSRLDSQTSKPRAPPIRYRVSVPTTPVGPLDLVSVPIFLRPLDPAVTVRSASLIVERRLQLRQTNTPPSPTSPATTPHTTTPTSPLALSHLYSAAQPSHQQSTYPSQHHTPHSMYSNGLSPTMQSNASIPSTRSSSPSRSTITESDTRPLLPRLSSPPPPLPVTQTVDVPSKLVVSSVAGAESSGRFVRDENGAWTKTLTVQWPAVKSSGRWAMGETMHTSLVSVQFFVRAKIIVSSPSGTETIELGEEEITVVSTNDAERQLALSKYNEMQYSNRSRSKSKSPRRTRRERDSELDELPSPPLSPPPGVSISSRPATATTKPSSSTRAPTHVYNLSSPLPDANRRRSNSATKRPHTSAGPRDKSSQLVGFGHGRGEDGYNSRLIMAARPDTAAIKGGPSSGSGSNANPAAFGQKWLVAPSLGVSPSASVSSTSRSSVDAHAQGWGKEISLPSAVDQGTMRAWEEELARIEVQSRRSTVDMGIAHKRKRVTEQYVR